MDDLPPIDLNELKEKIITDEIQYYDTIDELKNIIYQLKQYSDDALEQFKEVVILFTEELTRVTGDHMLSMYKSDVIAFINKSPKNIIDAFIVKAYECKNGEIRGNIVRGEEEYFLNHNLDELDKIDEIKTQEDKDNVLNVIFQFKNFWGKLTEDNKEIIKNTLLAIIALCDIRYLNYKKYLCLKKLNEKHKKIFLDTDKLF